jgi:peptidoglycan/xylan/chitin deacetylase (PgdA/CDA1 family)
MKQLTKGALCALYKFSGAMHAQERLARLRGRAFMVILLYHRVCDDIPEDGLTVSTGWFARTCKMLKRNFRVVPLAEIFRILKSGEVPPRRTLAITFDDCYRDNLAAARTLADHGLPACFFLPTGYVGTNRIFPWDRGLRSLSNLSWDDVREMVAMGHEIGSHTVSHPDMATIPVDQTHAELVQSKQTLEDRLGRPVRWFAYPFGGRQHFSPERLALVTEAGYEGCLSGFGGFVYPEVRDRIVPREPITHFRSLVNLELHLSGCLDWLYALKRRAGIVSPSTHPAQTIAPLHAVDAAQSEGCQ